MVTPDRVVDPESFEEPDHDHRIFHEVDMEVLDVKVSSPAGYGTRCPAVRTEVTPNVVEYRLDGETVETVRIDWDGVHGPKALSEYLG